LVHVKLRILTRPWPSVAVDESPGILGAVLLGNLDRLVDDDRVRSLGLVHQLVHGEAEDVSIDRRQPLEPPMRGLPSEFLVDRLQPLEGPAEENVGKLTHPVRCVRPLLETGLHRLRRCIGQLVLIQELEGELSGAATGSHQPALTRTSHRRIRRAHYFLRSSLSDRRAISMAARAASHPLFPILVPARSTACSRVSAVITPKVMGTPELIAA